MNKAKKKILIVGFACCAICALFPPRQYTSPGGDANFTPSHQFLFSPDFERFYFQPGLGSYYNVDVNGGRLLAELALVAAITGIAFLLQEWFAKYGNHDA
jgi:hypothetical protein